ncbi:AI-2E family transporter [Cellulophaga sp. BC115SP]|uniref:AI-2E family transporter n=1 Tax=Cellulophaga sp. BC115SP TaxID=2683263 RepID=UPI00141307C7|nr:AI-2E family transporter [Cellulophaga sp. BC115SP]NBB31572.1 AI-2E family transporter [Cellulophaga sp. BC115SP]
MKFDVLSNTLLRQIALILSILLLGGLLFVHLDSFIPALLGAYTLYILLGGWVKKMEAKWKMSRIIAIVIVMLGSFLMFLLPMYFVGQVLFHSHTLALDQYSSFFKAVKGFVEQIEIKYQVNLLDEKSLDKVFSWLTQSASKLINGAVNGITGIFLSYLILYFMLRERELLDKTLIKIFPLNQENSEQLLGEVNKLVFSNAIGIPVIGIVQGVTGLLIYLILGVPNAILWFLVTCIVSMIPILGSALAYIPVSILLFANHDNVRGLIMLLYGFFVIGSVDNIFRIWLQNKLGDTHPLITLFGVIVGVQLWGFTGLIFGPILFSLFLLLSTYYGREFQGKDENNPSSLM